MSHTKRSSHRLSEMLRLVKPYKRPKRHNAVKDFELSYIVINQNPFIRL